MKGVKIIKIKLSTLMIVITSLILFRCSMNEVGLDENLQDKRVTKIHYKSNTEFNNNDVEYSVLFEYNSNNQIINAVYELVRNGNLSVSIHDYSYENDIVVDYVKPEGGSPYKREIIFSNNRIIRESYFLLLQDSTFDAASAIISYSYNSFGLVEWKREVSVSVNLLEYKIQSKGVVTYEDSRVSEIEFYNTTNEALLPYRKEIFSYDNGKIDSIKYYDWNIDHQTYEEEASNFYKYNGEKVESRIFENNTKDWITNYIYDDGNTLIKSISTSNNSSMFSGEVGDFEYTYEDGIGNINDVWKWSQNSIYQLYPNTLPK